jgi:hypothetical protein
MKKKKKRLDVIYKLVFKMFGKDAFAGKKIYDIINKKKLEQLLRYSNKKKKKFKEVKLMQVEEEVKTEEKNFQTK